MAKEILLYSVLYGYTAQEFINQMEASKSSDVRVRMNTPGGDVLATYGIIAKFQEHAKGKSIQVDGQAKSCGFYMCLAADDVECLNVSEFLAHRAAYPEWLESDPEIFTDALKLSLNKTNGQLRTMIESRVTAAKFQAVTGVSLDQMFSLDNRVDVPITAQQAKEMGIVKKITDITGERKAEIVALSASMGVAAFSKEPEITSTQLNDNKMTAQEFKAANAAAYEAIVKEGVDKERARVSSFMVFNDVDPKAVTEAIEKGDEMTPKQMAEFGRKTFAAAQLGGITSDNAATVLTGEAAAQKTAEVKNMEAFEKEVAENLKKFKN